jgi:hypothetical protein
MKGHLATKCPVCLVVGANEECFEIINPNWPAGEGAFRGNRLDDWHDARLAAHLRCDRRGCKALAVASRVCANPWCKKVYARCATHDGEAGIARSLHSHNALEHPRAR